MKKIIFSVLLSVVSISAFATTTMSLKVNGLVCAFCAQGIEKRMKALPETAAVSVDLKKKLVLVQAKEGKTLNEKLIKEEIVDSGFEVVSASLIQKSIAEINK